MKPNSDCVEIWGWHSALLIKNLLLLFVLGQTKLWLKSWHFTYIKVVLLLLWFPCTIMKIFRRLKYYLVYYSYQFIYCCFFYLFDLKKSIKLNGTFIFPKPKTVQSGNSLFGKNVWEQTRVSVCDAVCLFCFHKSSQFASFLLRTFVLLSVFALSLSPPPPPSGFIFGFGFAQTFALSHLPGSPPLGWFLRFCGSFLSRL